MNRHIQSTWSRLRKAIIAILFTVILVMLSGCGKSKKTISEEEYKKKMEYELYATLYEVYDQVEGIRKLSTDSIKYEDYPTMTETMEFVEIRCNDLMFEVQQIIDKYALDVEGF